MIVLFVGKRDDNAVYHEIEHRSLMESCKRAQKLIVGVLQNTTEVYGSLKCITGSGAFGYIGVLELPEDIDT